MRESLKIYDNKLFFVDEDFYYLTSDNFSSFCKYTDSFFVIITRDYLSNLPYSFSDIYEMKASGKFHTLKRKFPTEVFNKLNCHANANCVVEDSNSGFTFFQKYYKFCTSANGKRNIKSVIDSNTEIVIADGAAFGSEIEVVLTKLQNKAHTLFLPESFEYLLLCSDLFKDNKDVQILLKDPYKMIDGLSLSWEEFFTKFLMNITAGFSNAYTKSNLNYCYSEDCCIRDKQKCNMNKIQNKVSRLINSYSDKVAKIEIF